MVDIVVVSYNTLRLLGRCVASIRAHTPPDAYRLWVVDNASTDGSAAWLSSQTDLALIQSPSNVGYARACNLGAARGGGAHILFLNGDAAPLPGWLPPLVATLESGERVAVVAPRLINEQGLIVGAGVVGTNAAPVVRLWMQPEAMAQDDRELDCVYLCGAAMMIKRRLVPELGLFDERYPFYFEDADYAYNARAHGYRAVYCPRSRVVHTWGGSGRADPRLSRHFEAGRRLFESKWASMMSDPRVYG